MRRTVLAVGMAAVTMALAGCGGAHTPALAVLPPTPTPTVAPAASPTPSPSPAPAEVPMAQPPLVRSTPAPTEAVPTGRPQPVAVRRVSPAPPAPQPPVIIRTSPSPSPAAPARVVSDNWAGYVAQGGGHWQVSGSWTEPSASCTATTAEAAFWVGLGGYPSYPLYQAGSGAFCRNGVPIHALWYELLDPGGTQPLVAVVQIQPGDRISASISVRAGGSGGVVHLADSTSGFTKDVAFTPTITSLATAEWIAEATSHGGTVSTLANFGSVTFSGCTADDGAAALAAWPGGLLTELSLSDRNGGSASPGGIGPGGGGSFAVGYTG